MTSQTPEESHSQEKPALSTNIGQEEQPLTWQNQKTGSNDKLKTSRKDESFTNQSQEPDESANEAPSQGISQEKNNTSQGQSLPSPNQGAFKDGGEIPPTNTSQGQSYQGACKDVDEIQPTNASQGEKKQTLWVSY